MTIFTMTLLTIFSIGLFWAGIQLSRMQKQLVSQQEKLKRLSSELNVTTRTSFGFGHRLVKIEKQLTSIKTQHQDLLAFGSDDQYQKRTFKQATHLAQMGASIDELRQSCELSHGEAELLSHMNLN